LARFNVQSGKAANTTQKERMKKTYSLLNARYVWRRRWRRCCKRATNIQNQVESGSNRSTRTHKHTHTHTHEHRATTDIWANTNNNNNWLLPGNDNNNRSK